MNKFFSLLAAITISMSSTAQNGGKVSGSIKDGGNQKIIDAATVSLLKAKDSSLVKAAITDPSGNFVFENVKDGKYLVRVTSVGHTKSYSAPVTISEGNLSANVGVLQLVPADKALKEVVVSSLKPLIERKIDRTIVNVDASITSAGGTALEVLEKSPGISVDKDGNISLKGKEGVMVLMDGRPTQLSGTDLANLLRSMSAGQLEQIEIMTNPPAKYDAAGNAGVINIKTKKNKQAGYNGSVSLGYGQGKFPKFNEALNMNYKAGKINFFTNVSHNYWKNYNTLFIQRNLRNKNTKALENYFDQEANMINEGNSYNGKIGVDFFASKKSTVGIVVTGFSNPSTFKNRNLTLISDAGHFLESKTRATVDYDQSWKDFSTNLNFRKQIDTTGKELTADLDEVIYTSINSQTLINSYFDPSEHSIQKPDTLLGQLPQQIYIYSGKVDYIQPLKKGARLEAGIKSSIVRTDNNAIYDSIQYGQLIHDINRSNHFIYKENINAAYINWSGQVSKKISAQLGLRMENTVARGNQITTGIQFEKKYTQLFPTAYFQYKQSEKNNFGLNYGRRIRRPNYENLNPFIRFLDRYTYMQGNPELRPQFSHNLEASHSYKNFLTTTVNYSLTKDIIQGVIEQKGQEAYAKQANIARLRQYGISVSVNKTINKWWTSNLYLNLYNNQFSGIVDSTPITFSMSSLSLNGSQQFKISKTFSAEVSGFYRSSGIEGVILIRPMGMVAAGITQQLWKNKATLRLNIRDIFRTQKTNARSNYGNVDASFQELRDSRVVNLGFTYRFSKGNVSNQKKHTSGSSNEEQNRVGIGN